LAEFERYADTFGVKELITFRTEVMNCRRRDDGRWAVTFMGSMGEETREYDFLIVANGHHWNPRLPELPGVFNGPVFHSHYYVDTQNPVDLREKNVVVVGVGNSAMDIACELGHTGQGARRVFLSQRSGVWVIPKIFGPVPQDKFIRHPMKKAGLGERFSRTFIPEKLRAWLFDVLVETIVRLTVGHPTRVGLKKPLQRFHERHPTVSQEIHNRLIHGDITPKGVIKELRDGEVVFEDGSLEKVDAIIAATGYDITFPFLAPELISISHNSLPLFQRIFEPRFDNLAFIGLIQPICAVMPIAELQANFLADYINGRYSLPERAEMERAAERYDSEMKGRYTTSDSHTIQIDCPEYSYYLQKEWKRGRKRAARGLGRLAGGAGATEADNGPKAMAS
ncbi:MAG: NAD(P)-binding domain-containing protein, partial [Sphingomonadales bacterium]